jgi:hypothetical protein
MVSVSPFPKILDRNSVITFDNNCAGEQCASSSEETDFNRIYDVIVDRVESTRRFKVERDPDDRFTLSKKAAKGRDG